MAWKLPKAQARALAHQFSLAKNGSEDATFDAGWDLKKYAADFAELSLPIAETEIRVAFAHFAHAVKQGQMAGSLGHRYLETRPVRGRYVVFSDHHLAHTGHRQNFMATSGNLDLYVEVLEQYLNTDFTLIENGDVEELLIFEPTEAELSERRAILDAGKGNAASWAKLDGRRRSKRMAQLGEILDDPKNAAYYAVLDRFNGKQRLVRVVGNHDYDLQKEDFLRVLRTKVHDIETPADYLFLTDDNAKAGENVRFAILHGHQFDTTCVPAFAPKLGELFSESLAWAYQGADRTWAWTGGGAPCRNWVEERKGFLDNLVTDDPGSVWGGEAGAAVGAFIGNLHSQAGWEELFGHNIAWEYFSNSDPQLAVRDEVETGQAFFKFRHLDEDLLREELLNYFPEATSRPKLVLGHTHEVRYQPGYMGDGPTGKHPAFPHYLNSGAAGRFENLLWAIEIIDGVETAVSWSRPRARSGRPERRVYGCTDLPIVGNVLQASASPIALPGAPTAATDFGWLHATLHMMMR